MTLELILQLLVFPALAYISGKVSDIRERLATVETKVHVIEAKVDGLPCPEPNKLCK
jgi:hypothetical protein